MPKTDTALMKKRLERYREYVYAEQDPDSFSARLRSEIVDCDAERQWLTLRFATKPWMQNPGGVVHGGILSSMFDIAMGCTSMALAGVYNPTVHLSVSFLSPGPLNDALLVTATATRVGRTFTQLTAEMVVESTGVCCATATGIFFTGGGEQVLLPQDE